MTDLPTEMLSVAEDLLTLAAPKQVEKMRDALLAAYQRGQAQGWRSGYDSACSANFDYQCELREQPAR